MYLIVKFLKTKVLLTTLRVSLLSQSSGKIRKLFNFLFVTALYRYKPYSDMEYGHSLKSTCELSSDT